MARAYWAEARVKIARMTLTIKLDRNWNSFQLANNTPPLSVTGSVIAPSARIGQMRACLGFKFLYSARRLLTKMRVLLASTRSATQLNFLFPGDQQHLKQSLWRRSTMQVVGHTPPLVIGTIAKYRIVAVQGRCKDNGNKPSNLKP